MKIPDDELRVALDELANSFRTDELAYLAVTSKSEEHLRDHLAYLLHKRYEADGYLVAREWNYVDLAVLNPQGQPICLLETKIMYTFNALFPTPRYNFEDFTLADMGKARTQARHETAVYSLLFAVNANNFESRYNGVIKYGGHLANALRVHGTSARVRDQAIAAVRARFASRNVVHHGEMRAGAAFGSEVTILFWLVRDRHPPY